MRAVHADFPLPHKETVSLWVAVGYVQFLFKELFLNCFLLGFLQEPF